MSGKAKLNADSASTLLKAVYHDTERKAKRAGIIAEQRLRAKKNYIKPKSVSLEKLNKSFFLTRLQEKLVKRANKRQLAATRLPSELAPVLFVVRTNSTIKPVPENEATMKRLRLTEMYTGVFLPNTRENEAILRKLDGYVFYGAVSQETVRRVITTLARCGDGEPLSSNLKVEECFAEESFLSINDLVNELYSVGPCFESTSSKLLPFKLKSLKKADGLLGKFIKSYVPKFDEVLAKII